MDERLQKILSQWGIASRRQAEEMIKLGRVKINGAIATVGQKANPEIDRIEIDGKILHSAQRPQPIYLLLHKPAGVVSTCSDPQQRTTVLDILPGKYRQGEGVHPVGRLDAESTGALLLTNDGELTFYLTHPRHSIAKTYQVLVKGEPSEAILQVWRQGVILAGRKTRPAKIQILERIGDDQTLLEIMIQEGRNRQIRRVAEQLGYPVLKLHRTAIGPIQLQNLPIGHYRHLKKSEIGFLKNQIQLISVDK